MQDIILKHYRDDLIERVELINKGLSHNLYLIEIQTDFNNYQLAINLIDDMPLDLIIDYIFSEPNKFNDLANNFDSFDCDKIHVLKLIY